MRTIATRLLTFTALLTVTFSAIAQEQSTQKADGYFALFVVMLESCAKTMPELAEVAEKPWLLSPIVDDRSQIEARVRSPEFQAILSTMREDAAKEMKLQNRSIVGEKECKEFRDRSIAVKNMPATK